MKIETQIKRANAGLRQVFVHDGLSETAFAMTVMYPTDEPEKEERLGPYSVEAARDASPRAGIHPLVLLSHGTGGTPFVYRSIARHLARNGFIVGLPEHPHNNRNDNSWEGTVQNLLHRPRHLRLAADWFYQDEAFKGLVKPEGHSVIGHSMGGYTALAAAGGVPASFPHESPDGRAQPIDVERDPRIRSIVLLAPASVWFREEGALSGVRLPILMLDAERDPYTPPYHAQIVLNGVADPSKVRYRTVKNAGHFAFLSPFPAEMVSTSFLPSQDPPGFDRAGFHVELQDEIAKFLAASDEKADRPAAPVKE